jgi:hypothetical protein
MANLRQQSLPTPWRIIYPAFLTYRNNFPLFLKLAMQGAGCFFISNCLFVLGYTVAVLGFFAAVVTYFSKGNQPWHFSGITLIISLVILYLCSFVSAKNSLNKGLMGLAAYQILTGRSESLRVSFHQIRPRIWQFWLLEAFVNTAISIMARITDRLESGWIILGLILQFFVVVQYFVSDIIIAVENCNAISAIHRSHRFSKSYLLPMSAVLVVTWIILIPLYLLTLIPIIFVWQLEWQIPELALSRGASILHLLQALGVSILLFTLVQILVVPLWQLIKASLYRELKH